MLDEILDDPDGGAARNWACARGFSGARKKHKAVDSGVGFRFDAGMQTNERTVRRLAVLKAIRSAGSVSRTELPALTGFSGATITEVSAELLARGLIVESRSTAKRPGRPRIFLEINAKGPFVMGANLAGGGRLTCTIVDLSGEQRFAMDAHLPQASSLEELVGNISVGLEKVLATSPFSRGDIAVAGIALPAILDSRSGVVHQMTAFPSPPLPFADLISSRLGFPITIETEASCMARAEHWFGRAQNLETFTLIYVGLALRSAEYMHGLPRVGANGFTSEIGHCKTVVDEHAIRCICGSMGCLMTYCSMHGIVAQAGQLDGNPFLWPDDLKPRFARVLKEAISGQPNAQALFARAGHHLGLALANHLNASDPGNVLLLFSDLGFFEQIRESYESALSENTLAPIFRNTRIQADHVTERWRLTGTAALALEQAYLGTEAPGVHRPPERMDRLETAERTATR